jgi:ribosome-binding protein aMBF1 (putative translation factor)
MKTTLVSKLAVSLVIAAFGATAAPLTFAQDTGSTATDATQAAPSTKAQKKAARKQARAKKNAELKKLEDAGYNPAKRDDANYPQDIQNAQKKAGIGQGASQ